MKRKFVAIVLVVAALAVFATGIVAAQAPQPVVPGGGRGPGMGGGQMRGYAANGQEGPLH